MFPYNNVKHFIFASLNFREITIFLISATWFVHMYGE